MLLRRQVSEERDEHIDMTPMVDVVFQLMTFMLFSMKLTAGDVVKVPEARHGVGVEEDAATFLLMAPPKVAGSRPRLLLGLKGEEEINVDRAVAEVSKGVKAGRRKVVLQADGDVPHGEVVSLIAEIGKREGGATVHVGVQEPQ